MQRSRLSSSPIFTSLSLCASLALAVGCAGGGSGGDGTGGTNSGTGGRSNTGTGGGANLGTGGATTGSGGGAQPGTGGSVVTGTGGTGTGTGGRAGGTGGSAGTGGAVVGGTGGAGGAVVTGTPGGYLTVGAYHGCTWTGVDVLNLGTTNTPQDFVTKTPAGFPYCVSGTVGADPINSASVALLGFNLDEAVTGAATQCAYKPADPTAVGPPGVSLLSATATGLAISYTRSTGSNIRVQIQGPNGGMNNTTGQNDRWCYTITQVQGPIFAPFSQFNTRCWDNSGTAYSGQPISAVSFLVPGTTAPSPFGYCIGGFAPSASVAAAPAYNPTPYPTLTGTIGGPGTTFVDFARVKVAAPGPGGKAYIIQNNNWGTPNGTDQTITYSGNTFTVVSTTGNVTGAGVPASFPSIYIGANGQTPGLLPGVLATTPDGDGLPKAISAINTLNTTFSYNRSGGDYNATYDVWLAAPPAPAIGYADALSAFVMVWLYQPAGRSPIGTMVGTATIGGRTWNVWVGPRGTAPNPNRPVISYVAPSPLLTLTFDMKAFLADAAVDPVIPAASRVQTSWLVTDLFAGFEIWTGSSAAGLQETAFSAVVQ